ncbi:MAG: hypothetical protein KGL53_12045, partial [Elusimicrobia bacterium]|nr:hypothetical protein [Elusimicrobiota bacterium]
MTVRFAERLRLPVPRRVWVPLLILAVLEAAAFGAFARRLGFYLDDYVLLESLVRHPGVWAGARALLEAGRGSRPVSVLLPPLVFRFSGLAPLAYQVALDVLDWAGAGLFFLFAL